MDLVSFACIPACTPRSAEAREKLQQSADSTTLTLGSSERIRNANQCYTTPEVVSSEMKDSTNSDPTIHFPLSLLILIEKSPHHDPTGFVPLPHLNDF